ncbi:MAG TPA: ATP-binding protein [Mariprofundaceae bacterium]|nr:ATP-binding protein [Mariprofundaceae bacterium]
MNRLFWKIFLWFLFTVLATGGLSFLAADYLAGQQSVSERHLQRIEAMATAAEMIAEEHGMPGLYTWLRHVQRRVHYPLLVVRRSPSDGWRNLDGLPVPPEVAAHMNMPASREGVAQSRQARHRVVSVPLKHIDGLYLVTVFGQRPLWARPQYRHLPLVIALAVSVVVCLLIAWSIARPVRRLRHAAGELADGNLAARADVGRRGDEIGRLAGDFNRMADRIEQGMRAQRQLLSDVSHELRSPLARLRVASELARRKATDDTIASELSRIDLEVGRLDTMLGDVLTLARLESNGNEVALAPCDIDALLDEVVADANFEYRGEGRRATVTKRAGCSVMADAPLLRSAIDNVVRNAMKYTVADSCVEAATRVEGKRLCLTVQDRGPGVPEAALPHLFDAFYRVDEARDRDSGGYGLGLAIAARACRLFGGGVHAENGAEGGLVVTMSFPLHSGVAGERSSS